MGHFYRTTIGPTLEYEINVGQQKEDLLPQWIQRLQEMAQLGMSTFSF